ncbi:apolipoprotein N-acyltransferase [Sorangium sp. So ce375]|uniref:apolipoprotein N-acyltransferase n=1 Tax=Sorangium sp. So ce375 TaxID=3133306 RepID=UPI003F5AEE3F
MPKASILRAFRSRAPLILSLAGGATFALTAPPTDLVPAVIVGLALLAAAVHDAPTVWRAFGRGAVWGTAAGIVGLRFVPEVIQRFTPLGSAASYLALVLLAAAQSLVWAVCGGITSALLRRLRAPLELAFATGVFAAVAIPTVFGWTPAGLMSPWPALVQLADLIGERGVSVLFAVGAALLARAGLAASGRAPGGRPLELVPAAPGQEPRSARFRSSRAILYPALSSAALFGLLAVHGVLRMAAVERASAGLPTAQIALVNQAVGPHERWQAKNHPRILRTLHELTREAEAGGAELTLWPEAAYPYPLSHSARQAPRGGRAILGPGIRGPILAGLITQAPPVKAADGVEERNSYNSATLVLPDGSMQPTQDKLQLLWFGETVPGGAYLPWLRRIFQKSGGLIPGAEPRALTLPREHGPALRIGVLNCYEDTLTGVGRWITGTLTPNLLVNITNDAWFTGSAEPELHARLAVMRAIELRRDLVRAVNLGVVSWIDARGVVRSRDESAAPGVTFATPSIRDTPLTPYTRLGDAPMASLLAFASIGCALRARRFTTKASRRGRSVSSGARPPPGPPELASPDVATQAAATDAPLSRP